MLNGAESWGSSNIIPSVWAHQTPNANMITKTPPWLEASGKPGCSLAKSAALSAGGKCVLSFGISMAAWVFFLFFSFLFFLHPENLFPMFLPRRIWNSARRNGSWCRRGGLPIVIQLTSPAGTLPHPRFLGRKGLNKEWLRHRGQQPDGIFLRSAWDGHTNCPANLNHKGGRLLGRLTFGRKGQAGFLKADWAHLGSSSLGRIVLHPKEMAARQSRP